MIHLKNKDIVGGRLISHKGLVAVLNGDQNSDEYKKMLPVFMKFHDKFTLATLDDNILFVQIFNDHEIKHSFRVHNETAFIEWMNNAYQTQILNNMKKNDEVLFDQSFNQDTYNKYANVNDASDFLKLLKEQFNLSDTEMINTTAKLQPLLPLFEQLINFKNHPNDVSSEEYDNIFDKLIKEINKN